MRWWIFITMLRWMWAEPRQSIRGYRTPPEISIVKKVTSTNKSLADKKSGPSNGWLTPAMMNVHLNKCLLKHSCNSRVPYVRMAVPLAAASVTVVWRLAPDDRSAWVAGNTEASAPVSTRRVRPEMSSRMLNPGEAAWTRLLSWGFGWWGRATITGDPHASFLTACCCWI